MRHLLLVVGLVALVPRTAAAWSAGMIDGDKAEMGRITCGLLEKYGPSRSYHDLSIAIPASPYGPLTATMGSSRRLELGVSSQRYANPPPETLRAEIRAWVLAQLPAKPQPCTFLLASPGWLDRVGYPDVPGIVPDEDYIGTQLDLAMQAAVLEPDWVWRWSDGALAAFRALPAAKRRVHERDARLRAGAYMVVAQPAPPGLSDVGKRGYCALYDSVESLFPPRGAERNRLREARRAMTCTAQR